MEREVQPFVILFIPHSGCFKLHFGDCGGVLDAFALCHIDVSPILVVVDEDTAWYVYVEGEFVDHETDLT